MPGLPEDARPVSFLSITDRDRASRFFQETLGLKLAGDEAFALVFDLGDVSLRLTIVDRLTPQPFTVFGWQVHDIERTVRGLLASGVVFERYEALEQDDLSVWTSPSGARIAWFKDPDGNILSVSQLA